MLPHQRTTYERPVLRPLLSPEEFADTPDDGAILITTGLRPARVWLPRWFDWSSWLRADPFAPLRALTAPWSRPHRLSRRPTISSGKRAGPRLWMATRSRRS